LYISLAMNTEAAQLISTLGLSPLPREGGFFVPTWTSPKRGPDGRPTGSAILFLITPEDFSAFHRLRTDELWHYHAGDPAELALLDPANGSCRTRVLGPDVAGGHAPFGLAPAGAWQGARILPGPGSPRGWTLLGCTLSPAWDEREFELGDRGELSRVFPAHGGIIRALTR
jgi:predicted cupin superfamily sugar epimerase